MSRIPPALREAVRERAGGYCEYCKASDEIILDIEVDHIRPRSADGPTTLDNLCYACPRCNGRKSTHQTGIDPESGQEVALYNPRLHRWQEHFRWNETFSLIIALTPAGRATLVRLDMNYNRAVQARLRWRLAGRPGLITSLFLRGV
jgi:hypothetical protein